MSDDEGALRCAGAAAAALPADACACALRCADAYGAADAAGESDEEDNASHLPSFADATTRDAHRTLRARSPLARTPILAACGQH